MIGNKEVLFLRQRILQERALTKSAACEGSRAAHAKMAKLYEARLTMSHVHEANSPHHLLRKRASVSEQAGFTDSLKKKRMLASSSLERRPVAADT